MDNTTTKGIEDNDSQHHEIAVPTGLTGNRFFDQAITRLRAMGPEQVQSQSFQFPSFTEGSKLRSMLEIALWTEATWGFDDRFDPQKGQTFLEIYGHYSDSLPPHYYKNLKLMIDKQSGTVGRFMTRKVFPIGLIPPSKHYDDPEFRTVRKFTSLLGKLYTIHKTGKLMSGSPDPEERQRGQIYMETANILSEEILEVLLIRLEIRLSTSGFNNQDSEEYLHLLDILEEDGSQVSIPDFIQQISLLLESLKEDETTDLENFGRQIIEQTHSQISKAQEEEAF